MTKRVFVTAEVVPNADYLIAGKEYELSVEDIDSVYGYTGQIFTEPCYHGEPLRDRWTFICQKKCFHLNGLDWTVRIEE